MISLAMVQALRKNILCTLAYLPTAKIELCQNAPQLRVLSPKHRLEHSLLSAFPYFPYLFPQKHKQPYCSPAKLYPANLHFPTHHSGVISYLVNCFGRSRPGLRSLKHPTYAEKKEVNGELRNSQGQFAKATDEETNQQI